MADRLRELFAKVLDWWNKFTSRQKSIIIGIAAAVVFTFAIIIYIATKPQYMTLMTCSTTAEAASVIEVLDSSGIAHKESATGLKIEVERSQISSANLALGAAGYVPDDYDLEKALASSLSTTTADTAKRYKLYMERKLESEFESQPMIKTAYVNLDIPDQDGTLIAQQQSAGAYIQLELSGTFTNAQAMNMAKAVATYLGNSDTSKITILDQDFNALFEGTDDTTGVGIASSMQELQRQAVSMTVNDVKKVLLGSQQFNTVDVAANLDVDYSEYERTRKEYYAPDGHEQGMYASQRTYESEGSTESGGTPGTDSNNETNTMIQTGGDSNSSSRESEIYYLPNELAENEKRIAGAIDKSNSSIAVTMVRIKEIREEDVRNQGLLDGISWEEYKANNRADTKLEVDEDYYSLVANATGISEDRITIIAYETPLFYDREGLSVSGTTVASGVLFALILGLLAFVVLRTMVSKRAPEQEEELSVEDLLQSNQDQVEDIDVETKSETRKLIEKFVDENPEAVASLLRNWLNEDWA